MKNKYLNITSNIIEDLEEEGERLLKLWEKDLNRRLNRMIKQHTQKMDKHMRELSRDLELFLSQQLSQHFSGSAAGDILAQSLAHMGSRVASGQNISLQDAVNTIGQAASPFIAEGITGFMGGSTAPMRGLQPTSSQLASRALGDLKKSSRNT